MTAEPIPLKSLGPTPQATPALSATDYLPSRSTSQATLHLHGSQSIDGNASAGDLENSSSSSPQYIPALPPVDTGRQAWSFLVAATVLETLIWGMPYTVGVFHEYWTSVMFKGQGEGTVTLAATLQTGLMYMSSGLFGFVFAKFPRRLREIQLAGLFISGVGLIASAFVTEPWHLVVTIGCLYPFAGAPYVPAATLLFEWFQAKRGLASGILFAGTGIGGAVIPLIVTSLLKGIGYKATMLSLGIGFLIIGGTSVMFIKRRIPLPRADGRGHDGLELREEARHRKIDWSFLRRWTMFAGTMTIFMTSLGNFVPSVWLPSFAADLNLTSPGGSGLISIMNAASVPGLTLLGFLSDRLPLLFVLGVSCIGSALSCLFLWGFGTTDTLLIVFVIAFGLLGLSFAALWGRMISVIARDDPALPQIVFCIFAFVRGLGNISSGPVSESLLKYDHLRGAAGAYGVNNYGVLLVYTGVTIFCGAITSLPFYGK